ncbi:major centromere autoantigen B-like [Lineus longissimus]|uniref:major centromere autoantigen B-like n=1 Tax=Lineus longissimus TaxID=88925 RepID=UPI00315DB46F
MERNLYDWFMMQRGLGMPIAGRQISHEALRLYTEWWDDLGMDRQAVILREQPTLSDFTASNGWRLGFLKRHGITCRRKTKDDKQLPEHADEVVTNFRNAFHNTVRDTAPSFIANLDETFALFDALPNYTYDTKGNRQVNIKSSRGNTRLGCSVTLGITSNGRKMPCHITFKTPTIAAREELRANPPPNVHIAHTETGWVRTQVLLDLIEEIVIPFVGADVPYIHLWDRARIHLNDDVAMRVVEIGGIIELIPPKCTPLLQPLDLTVMGSFKSKLRSNWRAWKEAHTVDGQCPLISHLDVARLIGAAWDEVPPNVVISGFRAAGILGDGNDEDGDGNGGHELEANDDEEGDGLEYLPVMEQDQ